MAVGGSGVRMVKSEPYKSNADEENDAQLGDHNS